MRVQIGFSGEMQQNQWRKADVDVDEVDFARILADEGIDVDPASVPRRLKFQIMEAEAVTLLYAEMSNFGGAVEEITQKIKEAGSRQQEALKRLRGNDGS